MSPFEVYPTRGYSPLVRAGCTHANTVMLDIGRGIIVFFVLIPHFDDIHPGHSMCILGIRYFRILL